jgi:hypothetical protein
LTTATLRQSNGLAKGWAWAFFAETMGKSMDWVDAIETGYHYSKNWTYSALRLSMFRFFVVCCTERSTQQKICGLSNWKLL